MTRAAVLGARVARGESLHILVAGAAGFLGSHLVDRLLAAGHHVLGIDSLLTGDASNLAHLTGNPAFAFRTHDVCTPFWSERKLAFDGVFHLASPASPPDYLQHPLATLQVGAEGTRQLLEFAELHTARFFLASTSEVYGDPLVHPQPETYWGNVNPIGPRSVYDEAKRYAEAITQAYQRLGRVETRTVRIFNTYGPRMRPRDGRVISNLIRQALTNSPLTIYGDGQQSRSFCYVSDEVEGLYRLFLDDGDAAHLPTNIGNPGEFTIQEVAERVRSLTGTRAPIERAPLPEDDPRQRCPDITRAVARLGWSPTVGLDDGLRATITHFRALQAAGHPL
jgi:dTDP-glucose 4,6-dehydratase